ncbi:hypothetical protein D3C78_1759190 [compost metagenome]
MMRFPVPDRRRLCGRTPYPLKQAIAWQALQEKSLPDGFFNLLDVDDEAITKFALLRRSAAISAFRSGLAPPQGCAPWPRK